MNEDCVSCGSEDVVEVQRERRIEVNGHEVVIPDDLATHCNSCDETFYTGTQAKIADRRLIDARRRAEGLLTSDEIRRLRHSLQLAQAELEAALGVGPKTVVRWENGTAVQGKAMDDVLRLIALDPDNLRLLVRIRDTTLTALVEHKIMSEKLKKNAWLAEAIYAGLERANVVDSESVTRVVNAIARAIRAHKRDRIEKLTQAAVG